MQREGNRYEGDRNESKWRYCERGVKERPLVKELGEIESGMALEDLTEVVRLG